MRAVAKRAVLNMLNKTIIALKDFCKAMPAVTHSTKLAVNA